MRALHAARLPWPHRARRGSQHINAHDIAALHAGYRSIIESSAGEIGELDA